MRATSAASIASGRERLAIKPQAPPVAATLWMLANTRLTRGSCTAIIAIAAGSMPESPWAARRS